MSGQVNYLEEAPASGQDYYYLYIWKKPFYPRFRWVGHDLEQSWLNKHRVYQTKKAAKFIKNFFISHKEQLNYLTSEPIAGTKVWFGFDMDGSNGDCREIAFNRKNKYHQNLLKNFRLYGTHEDLVKDASLITEALAEEYKKAH